MGAKSAAKVDSARLWTYLHAHGTSRSGPLVSERRVADRAVSAGSHPRTRERLLALRDIARGRCVSALCKPLGRHVTTVLKWVHDFNARGPRALPLVVFCDGAHLDTDLSWVGRRVGRGSM